MTVQADSLRIGVDLPRFLNVVTPAFYTKSYTLLDELVQNAQRAGAKNIVVHIDADSIQVTDDGKGCENFSNLLTIGKTGWSSDTQSNENPFGLGFWSVLPLSEHVTVYSRGKQLEINVRAIRAGNMDGAITDFTDWPANINELFPSLTNERGFHVTLHLRKDLQPDVFDPLTFTEHLSQLARFLPLDSCTINGTSRTVGINFTASLNQPHERSFTQLGGLDICGVLYPSRDEYTWPPLRPYYCSRQVAGSFHVAFLSGIFNLGHGVVDLRAPDRKDFISNDKLSALKAALDAFAVDTFSRIVLSGTDEDQRQFDKAITHYVPISLLDELVEFTTLAGGEVDGVVAQASNTQRAVEERERKARMAEALSTADPATQALDTAGLPRAVLSHAAFQYASPPDPDRSDAPTVVGHGTVRKDVPLAYVQATELLSCAQAIQACHEAGIQVTVLSLTFEVKVANHRKIPHVRDAAKQLRAVVDVHLRSTTVSLREPLTILTRFALLAEVDVEVGDLGVTHVFGDYKRTVKGRQLVPVPGKVFIDQSLVEVSVKTAEERLKFVSTLLIPFAQAACAAKGYGDISSHSNYAASLTLLSAYHAVFTELVRPALTIRK